MVWQKGMVELVLPASARYLSLVRSTISQMPSLSNIERSIVEDTKVAVVEALTNAIKHTSGQASQVEFMFLVEPEKITVTVRYTDPEFELELIPGMDEKPDLTELPESGLGIYMMRSLMDHVEYTTDGTGDVELIMVRLLSTGDEDT